MACSKLAALKSKTIDCQFAPPLMTNQTGTQRLCILGHMMAKALCDHKPDVIRRECQGTVLGERGMNGVNERVASAVRLGVGDSQIGVRKDENLPFESPAQTVRQGFGPERFVGGRHIAAA